MDQGSPGPLDQPHVLETGVGRGPDQVPLDVKLPCGTPASLTPRPISDSSLRDQSESDTLTTLLPPTPTISLYS